MEGCKEFLISLNKTIKDAIVQLNIVEGKGIFVVSQAGEVVGSITDGDIRRAILSGASIEDRVDLAMKKDFIFGYSELDDFQKRALIDSHGIYSVPIVDRNMRIVDIYSVDSLISQSESHVVLLAGGMGTRLGKITESLPKPMVKIAGKPMLEIILRKIVGQGFKNFFIAVHYKAELIEDYFQDGIRFGCKITYLREKKRLGTAGPLSLLPKNLKAPLIVMNGDLLTQVDLALLLRFHQEQKSKITICIRDYQIQVPYGVVEVNNGFVSSFGEKPVHNFNVNAGIYVIDPEILALIPEDLYYDMSTLLGSLIEMGTPISCFPVLESWMDVGQKSDLILARELYNKKKG